jgi:hypothetical protein
MNVPTNTFLEKVAEHRPGLQQHDAPIRVLGLDPGETTGMCVFEGTHMRVHGQIATANMPWAAVNIADSIQDFKPDIVVMEDYRVYKWKTDSHAWAELHTPKLIGAVEYICHLAKIKLYKQSAQTGKGFCTDERLKQWGFYKTGTRHGNDAVRHVCQWLMFGEKL